MVELRHVDIGTVRDEVPHVLSQVLLDIAREAWFNSSRCEGCRYDMLTAPPVVAHPTGHTNDAKVFGSQARLGDHAKAFTFSSRMRDDPELQFWTRVIGDWERATKQVSSISWHELHFPNFPGIARLRDLEEEGNRSTSDGKARKRGQAARRWILVLSDVLFEVHMKLLRTGSPDQQRTFRQFKALPEWGRFMGTGLQMARMIHRRLENLTRVRILTKTRVLLCTVDSTERMLREMEDELASATREMRGDDSSAWVKGISLDTAIMDEAGCVLETAVPVILALGVNNLTLVGDHHQLRPFSAVRDIDEVANHSRSLMERALEAGFVSQFLDVQYRMHPIICQVPREY